MSDSNEAGVIGGYILGGAVVVGFGLLIRGAYLNRGEYVRMRHGGTRRRHARNRTRKA